MVSSRQQICFVLLLCAEIRQLYFFALTEISRIDKGMRAYTDVANTTKHLNFVTKQCSYVQLQKWHKPCCIECSVDKTHVIVQFEHTFHSLSWIYSLCLFRVTNKFVRTFDVAVVVRPFTCPETFN